MTGIVWSVPDVAVVARLIAVVLLGQAQHAARIIAALEPAAPAFLHAVLIADAKRQMVIRGDDEEARQAHRAHRDGFLFECISWIAARQDAVDRTFLKDPHIDATSHGLDGLIVESGMEMGVLDRLRLRLLGMADELPTSIPAWVDWILDWLGADEPARLDLLSDTLRAVNASIGRGAELPLSAGTMQALKPAARAWLEGRPLNEVERLLGGTPNGANASQRQLPRAREFVSTVVPRNLSFLAGVVARMAQELGLADDNDDNESVLRALSGAVRRGFDTVPKLEFANANRRLVGRVATHLAYDEAADD